MRGIKKRLFSFLSEATNSTSLYKNVKLLAARDSAQYAYEKFMNAVYVYDRDSLLKFAVSRISELKLSTHPVVMEFGVWKGESINRIASLLPESKIFGFDSFDGLEENWTGMPEVFRGTFNLDGKPPKVRKNVRLIIGSYEQTLEKFLKSQQGFDVSLVHLDSDTYSPTAFVLNEIYPYLKKGTLIIFDEYLGFPNWRNHEFKAWQEYVRDKNISYEYIAYSGEQVLIEIT